MSVENDSVPLRLSAFKLVRVFRVRVEGSACLKVVSCVLQLAQTPISAIRG